MTRSWRAGSFASGWQAIRDIEIVAECANGFEAVKAATELKPDLLMLDIQMPKLDGFDVLELVGGDIPVIFITAYDRYAVRAFEVHAVDYLLKPFSAERLAEALDRARARIRSKERPPVEGGAGRGEAGSNAAAADPDPRARRSARHSRRERSTTSSPRTTTSPSSAGGGAI